MRWPTYTWPKPPFPSFLSTLYFGEFPTWTVSGTGGPPSSSATSLSALRAPLSGSSIPRLPWSPSPPPSPATTSAGLISSRSLSSALAAALVALRLVSAGGGTGAGAAASGAPAAAAGLPCASRALRAALRSTGILSHGASWPRLHHPFLRFRRRSRGEALKLRGETNAAARGGRHRDRDAG